MKKTCFVTMLGLWTALLLPATAHAQEAPVLTPEAQQAEEMARRALEDMMSALQLFFRSIPQYEAPVINERGDIIIRRKNPLPPKPRSKPTPDVPGPVPEAEDSTRT